MAKKAPSNTPETTAPADLADPADQADQILEKMRAGLTRAQAEHVIAAQAEHDHLLAQAATA